MRIYDDSFSIFHIPPEDGAALTKTFERWFEYAVADLRDAASSDQRTLELLDDLRLVTNRHFTPEPNAYAYLHSGKPYVAVDVGELVASSTEAVGAALWITAATDTMKEQRLASFRKHYLSSENRAEFEGSAKPLHTASLKDFVSKSVRTRVGSAVCAPIVDAGIAWLTLHEVGHHVLGHMSTTSSSLAENRAREREADSWAYQHMNLFGYALYELLALFLVKALKEKVDIEMGAIVHEDMSTHPSWQTRQNDLLWFVLNTPATLHGPSSLYVESMLTVNDSGEDEFSEKRIILPNHPRRNYPTYGWAYFPDQGMIPAAVIYDRESVHVYQRLADEPVEWMLNNPEHHETVGGLWFLESGRRRAPMFPHVFRRASLRRAYDRDVGGTAFRHLVSDPIAVAEVAMHEAGLTSDEIGQCIAAKHLADAASGQALLQYMQGRTEALTFERETALIARQFEGYIVRLLGRDRYETLEDVYRKRSAPLFAEMDRRRTSFEPFNYWLSALGK